MQELLTDKQLIDKQINDLKNLKKNLFKKSKTVKKSNCLIRVSSDFKELITKIQDKRLEAKLDENEISSPTITRLMIKHKNFNTIINSIIVAEDIKSILNGDKNEK